MDAFFLAAATPSPASLLSLEGVTVAGLLLAAVVILWRMNGTYSKRVQEGWQKMVENLTASHEATQGLLKTQNEALEKQVASLHQQYKDEKALREKEWKEHHQMMMDITTEYRKSQEAFTHSMNSVQDVMRDVQAGIKEQTSLLKEMAGVPQKVDQIQKDVDALWQRQRDGDSKP